MEATKCNSVLKIDSKPSSRQAGRALYRWRLLLARCLLGSLKIQGFASYQVVRLRGAIPARNKFLAGKLAPDTIFGERWGAAVVTGGNPVCALQVLRKLVQRKRFGARSEGPAVEPGGHSVRGKVPLFRAQVPPLNLGSGEIVPEGNLHIHTQIDETRDQIFVRVVRHELLTPLSGVVGMLDLVDNKGLLDPLGKLSLTHAKDSARTLVEQLLLIMDYTSLVEGQIALNLRQIQLPQLFQELAASWQVRAEAKGLKFVVQMLPGAPHLIKVDPHRFRRLMEILLSNAVKFTHSGEVAIGVGPGPRVWVRDSGIGISREQQALIFQPFKQIDESLARRHAGMGLGLAVAYHLANAMKGLLSVTSQPGKGSVFSFKLLASGKKPLKKFG